MENLSVSKARNELLPIIRSISKNHKKYVLSYHGHPAAIVMDLEEYKGLLETVHLLKDPEMVKGIKEAERDIKKGRTYSIKEVFDRMLKEK